MFVSGDFVYSLMVLNLRRRGAFPILALGRIKDFPEGSSIGASLSTTTVS